MPTSNPGAEPKSWALAKDDELSFQKEMFREFEAGNAHCFILHFNVHDFVFAPSLCEAPGFVPQRLREYLAQLFLSRGFQVVLYYSLSGGLTYLEPESMRRLVEEAVPQDVLHQPRFYGQGGPEDRVAAAGESQVALSYLYRLLTCKDGGKKMPRIAAILEYLETVAPHENMPHGPEAPLNRQLLHRLGMARQMSRNHLVVGLTADLGHVASSLYAADSDWRVYRVDLPIEELQSRGDRPLRRDRSDWLEFIVNRGLAVRNLPNPLEIGGCEGAITSVGELARQTSGFNYDHLRSLVFYAAGVREPITIEMVHKRKRSIIVAESRDLLEVVEPRDGFEVLAGYAYVKERLRKIRDAIRNQATDAWAAKVVPKGILFLGPPGTGKSLMAAALAKETGFNMVKLRNIRTMWVGETERNLNRVLDLLSAMHPVIVFVDEIDGAFVGRDSPDTGGGGVEQRILQRILEFMALDENRGHVLWIAASNRPDRVDAALMSRFDMVIPFLLPDEAARRQMFTESFPKRDGFSFQPEPPRDFDEFIQRTKGFSGRELDTLLRRAMQLAAERRATSSEETAKDPMASAPVVSAAHLLQALKEFRQARDQETYELQTLLAIQATNFYPFLPSRDELPESIRAAEGDLPIDEAKLAEEIVRLKRLLHELR